MLAVFVIEETHPRFKGGIRNTREEGEAVHAKNVEEVVGGDHGKNRSLYIYKI